MSRIAPFLSKRSSGFTIVELIVVIVVIVILALIVVGLYDNLGPKATDVTLQSDLDHAMDQLAFDNHKDGSYPTTAAQVDGGKGFALTAGNTITYTKKPYGYCLVASNPDANNTYMARSTDRKVQQGNCDTSVSLVAGVISFASGGTGFADGPATSARFNDIEGMTVAKNGDIYVSDFANYRIRKIDTQGNVTTVAGTGAAGCTTATTGPALSTQIEKVNNIVYDNQTDALYFMGCSGSKLFRVTSDGTATVLAGWGYTPATWCNGQGTAAGFYWSRGLALGADGNLYVGATELQRVCKVTKSGAVSVVAGSGTAAYAEGTGTGAQFNWPWGIASDSAGNLFVADARNCKIRKVTPSGATSLVAGSTCAGNTSQVVNGNGANAQFTSQIDNMTIDPTTGNLYVMEGDLVRQVTPAGDVTTVPIKWPTVGGGSYITTALTFDKNGILYVGTYGGVLKILI